MAGGRLEGKADGRLQGRRRKNGREGEPGTGLAGRGETAEVPGDRAKDRKDKIRATGSYGESWVEGEEFTEPLTVSDLSVSLK